MESYREAGVDRVLFELTDQKGPDARDAVLRELDELRALNQV